MSERGLQNWELRQREKRDQALRTISSAFEDLRMLEDWSRRTPNYEVECMCGRRLSVRTRADEAHEARVNLVAALTAERDQALADRARDRRVVDAAKAVVERLAEIPESDKQAMYEADESEPHIAELLDQLATEVREVGTDG